MATSGQILGDILSGESSYLDWQLVSQDVTNNKSTLWWQVGWKYPAFACRGLRQGSAHMNGVLVYNNQAGGDGVHAFSSSHTTAAGDHPPGIQFAAGAVEIVHDADGTKTFSADVSIRGWQGGGPNFLSDGSNSWALPTIPRNPGIPSTPTYSAVEQTQLAVEWLPNVADGLPNTSYTISYGTATDATGSTTTSAVIFKTITGLNPGVKYYFKVKAHNSIGEGPYSEISNMTTVAGAYVNDGGVWKKAIPYVKVAGVWTLARPYSKILGVWKKSIN